MQAEVRAAIHKILRYEMHEKPYMNPDIYAALDRKIDKLKKKEMLSTISYLKWEQDFLTTLKDGKNNHFVEELEAKRINEILFEDSQDNLLVTIILTFEAAVAIKYENDIRNFMNCTCEKFRNMTYKVVSAHQRVPLAQLLIFIKDIDEIDLNALQCPTMLKRAREIFLEIVNMIKYLGYFITKMIIYIYTGNVRVNFKSEYHTLGLILNTLLVPKYTFQRYAFYLAKLLSVEDQKRYFDRRRLLLKQRSAFEDLIFLNKFIVQADKGKLIRKNTISSTTNLEIKDLNALFENKVMDMNEFLSHLQLKVKLELDEVFCSDLKTIVEYFKEVEQFITTVFQNAELEIKIDLMRLILRITSSMKFVNYIYVLNAMKLDFLNECQIFALFCQVLLAEITKPAIRPPVRKVQFSISPKLCDEEALQQSGQPEISEFSMKLSCTPRTPRGGRFMDLFKKGSCDEVKEASKEEEFEEYDIYAENSSYLSAESSNLKDFPASNEQCTGQEECRDNPETICPTDCGSDTAPQESSEIKEQQ